MSTAQRQDLERKLKSAQQLGDVRLVKWILALFAVSHDQSTEHAARVLDLSAAQVERYVFQFLCYGVRGVGFKKPSGRRPKLTKDQQRELADLIDAGPQRSGFSGACWRSPMIQQLIKERFGIAYNVFYIAQLLKNLGFSFQKAKFVSDHLDEIARRRWRNHIWPQIQQLARERKALLLFGDEASFPQWGTLTYTWARRGQQPVVKTSGKRKGYKVFGLIDYFTGRFFHQGQEGRFTSACYTAFLSRVLEQTTQHLILIQDGAPYHTSAETKRFFAQHADRLTVFQLPGYSPDYNPVEKLWKKLKQQETHLHYFPTFEALTKKVEQALIKFENAPREILALCSLPEELAWAA
ncbi:MAG: IS630 family transposase [Pyrinomonadaceae bacterium]|nr:IS630 family transposase [Pyrinomonadaceae bacterium]